MVKPKTTYKQKSVPDDPNERIAHALNGLDAFAAGVRMPPEQHQRLRSILNEWMAKELQMRALGIHATKRDYRLFMLKRLEVY